LRWFVLACALVTGCASVKTTPSRIAHVCSALPAQRDAQFQRAYLEIASVKKRDLPALKKLAQQSVPAIGVTGVVAEHETPVALEWDRCLDNECKLKLHRTLLIAAYLPPSASEAMRIDVLIREGVGEHASVYSERVETRDQHAATIDEHGDHSLLVITPYLLGDDRDVQNLLACKQPDKVPTAP